VHLIINHCNVREALWPKTKKNEPTKDEEVDGPRVAARIIDAMPASNKERLVRAIKAADPQIALKIEANLTTFEDIATLFPQGIQTLIKEVDHKDLVVSLKKASEKVKTALFENMSERKRTTVQEDFATLPQMPLSEVQDAQARITKKLDELRTAGLIRSQSEHDAWV